MTTTNGPEITFEKVGIDTSSNTMKLFRAILLATKGYGASVTFSEIQTKLKELGEKKTSKVYLYKLLRELEDDKFVYTDTIKHPRHYSVSRERLIKALEKKRDAALSSLLSKRQDLTTRINLLRTVNAGELAITIFNNLSGNTSILGSVIIEGIENVRSTIIREFAEASKPGDIVRILAPGSLMDGGLEESGLVERRLISRARDGIRMIGVIMPQKHQEFTTKLITMYLRNIGKEFANLAATANIGIKVAKEFNQTYRMVSLNDEKMLLYLTHSAESDVAALIHRRDNPGLIDDAIKAFDRLFEEGIDVMDIVRDRIKPERED